MLPAVVAGLGFVTQAAPALEQGASAFKQVTSGIGNLFSGGDKKAQTQAASNNAGGPKGTYQMEVTPKEAAMITALRQSQEGGNTISTNT